MRFSEPLGFFDFLSPERDAFCVLSDSGTVQEECCISGSPTSPCATSTERPETIECGSNVLSGLNSQSIRACTAMVLERQNRWDPRPEYLAADISAASSPRSSWGTTRTLSSAGLPTAPSASPAI